MKTLAFTLIGFLAFMSTSFGQMTAMDEEGTPIALSELKKSDVPAAVTAAIARDFKDYVPTTLSTFPYNFKKYGWSVNTEDKEPIDHYEVHLTTKSGSRLDAVYSSAGNLIRYRQLIKNEALPKAIVRAIESSNYKDWKILGDHELVKGNPKEFVDHYIVKVRNGNQVKNLYLDEKGIFLFNN